MIQVKGGIQMKMMNRVILYLFGLFIITIGINLSIISDLGISPVSAFTYPLSQAIHITLGTITFMTYACLMLIQWLLLGKRFQLKNLLQVPFSLAFGFFVDLTGQMLSFIQLHNYIEQFLCMILGIVICAIGATIYIVMDIVPNAPEGFNLAVSQSFQMPFSKAKILSDLMFIGIGIFISIIFIGHIVAIREGTLISALLTGKLIGVFTKHMEPTLKSMAFSKEQFILQQE